MRKYQMSLVVFIIFLILLTGFKKNTGQQNIALKKSPDTNNYVGIFTEPVKVSIAGTTAIKGDKGQRPVKVMVYLSQATTKPVTVKYSTENGSAKAGADYVATSGSITFEPGEITKWITVSIIGEVAAEADGDAAIVGEVNVQVIIREVRNAILENGTATITIINIPREPRISGAVYEVIISFTGHTSLFGGTAEECGTRPNGIVVLSGLLEGRENGASNDDVIYTGTLQMIVEIDICSAKRQANGEDALCSITVGGSGLVKTTLEIYPDSRGGYIQIKDTTSRGFTKNVGGTCDPEQTDEERKMVPLKTIASIFNGKELPMLLRRTLHKGIYQETDDQGNITVVEVLRKIR